MPFHQLVYALSRNGLIFFHKIFMDERILLLTQFCFILIQKFLKSIVRFMEKIFIKQKLETFIKEQETK